MRALLIATLLSAAPSTLAEASEIVEAEAERSPAEEGSELFERFDLRLSAAQLYTTDNQSQRHVSFMQIRSGFEGDGAFGQKPLTLALDARFRVGLNRTTAARQELTRAYVRYAVEGWSLAVGRQTMASVLGARVDGAQLGIELAKGVSGDLFAGLMPHPITGAFNVDFLTAGLGYVARRDTWNNAGGLAAQLYDTKLDRLYFTERGFVRLGSKWLAYGHATIDLIRSGTDFKPDLTNGQVAIRYRPARLVDFTLSGSHVHVVLPNRWFDDWIAQERARVGFTVPIDPVGTRRTSGRLTSNVHLADFTPYVTVRYDRRHEDAADELHGVGGIKYDNDAFGFIDVSGAYRQLANATNQIGAMQVGLRLAQAVTLDVGAGVLRTTPRGGAETAMIYDVNAGVWADLTVLGEWLDGVSVLSMYQGFFEPDVGYHVFYVRLGYRLRG